MSRKKAANPSNAVTPVTESPDEAPERLALLAWAIAHPARVRIVRLLIAREACVCGEIVDELPLAQSTVSQHLKILKDSGLIQGEVAGPKVCYCINADRLDELRSLVGELSARPVRCCSSSVTETDAVEVEAEKKAARRKVAR